MSTYMQIADAKLEVPSFVMVIIAVSPTASKISVWQTFAPDNPDVVPLTVAAEEVQYITTTA